MSGTSERDGEIDAGRIAERLAGRHLLLTGVTGFVGEALLELLLAEVPDATLTLLVRPKGSTPGTERIRSLIGKPIFAATVEAAGGTDAVMSSRIRVLEGDLGDVPALPDDLDAVVHCAGDVSFDPPVDEGFRTNVLGTRGLLERIAEVGPDVHYVHVSTAYVAGRRRGAIPEAPVDHTVDVDAEIHPMHVAQATHEEPGSHEQDYRDRGLDQQEQRSRAGTRDTCTTPAFFERA